MPVEIIAEFWEEPSENDKMKRNFLKHIYFFNQYAILSVLYIGVKKDFAPRKWRKNCGKTKHHCNRGIREIERR